MHLVRSMSVGLALMALTYGAPAAAQLEPPGQLSEQGDRATGWQLGQTWYETEGDWQGVWSQASPGTRNGAYNAAWHIGRQTERATLQITIRTPLVVEIVRTQPDGQRCNYRGFFNDAGTVVSGTYTCDWARRPMNWRATIGRRIEASQATDAPTAIRVFDYLGKDWVETEGDWHGRWTQINPGAGDGYYNARWTKGNEHATATLQMSVDASGNMTVRRRDPDGRQCTYTGVINTHTLRSVSGNYRCTGQDNFLPWRATIVP